MMLMTFKLQYTNCIILSDKVCTCFNGDPNSIWDPNYIIKYGPTDPFSMGSKFCLTPVDFQWTLPQQLGACPGCECWQMLL